MSEPHGTLSKSKTKCPASGCGAVLRLDGTCPLDPSAAESSETTTEQRRVWRPCYAKCGKSTTEQPLPASWGAIEIRLPGQPIADDRVGHGVLVFCSPECGAVVLRELASVLCPNPIRDFLEGRPIR